MNHLALLLLVLIPQSKASSIDKFLFKHFSAAIQSWAIKAELLDPREHRYVFTQDCNFQTDWALLLVRYKELKDAPLIAEAARFPDRALVNDMIAFNRAYRADICQRLSIDTIHENELRAVLTEIDQLYLTWDSVRDAQCDYYYISIRRSALKRLRARIGATAYYSGELPPYVPIWRIPVRE